METDFLKADLSALVHAGETADVIGNLPCITSDILLKLFAAGSVDLARAVLMMQREVADRVAASPGVRDYGLLSPPRGGDEWMRSLPFRRQLAAARRLLHRAALNSHRALPGFGIDATGFDVFLRQCFAQKRKTLRNNLRVAGYTAETLDVVPEQARARCRSAGMAELYRALKANSQIPD